MSQLKYVIKFVLILGFLSKENNFLIILKMLSFKTYNPRSFRISFFLGGGGLMRLLRGNFEGFTFGLVFYFSVNSFSFMKFKVINTFTKSIESKRKEILFTKKNAKIR